jgi:hypothetical protein
LRFQGREVAINPPAEARLLKPRKASETMKRGARGEASVDWIMDGGAARKAEYTRKTFYGRLRKTVAWNVLTCVSSTPA